MAQTLHVSPGTVFKAGQAKRVSSSGHQDAQFSQCSQACPEPLNSLPLQGTFLQCLVLWWFEVLIQKEICQSEPLGVASVAAKVIDTLPSIYCTAEAAKIACNASTAALVGLPG